MLSSKTSFSFTLVYLLLLILPALFFFSNGGSQSPTSQTTTPSSVFQGGKPAFLSSLGSKDGNSSSLVLAQERTRRKDIFNHFRKYTGGWNISDRHYWASVAFTGAPLFAIAVVWFLSFVVCSSVVCICYCCYTRTFGYNPTLYGWSFNILTFFTVTAIVGCIVLYTCQGKFHGSTTRTLRYIVHQADTTSEKLRNLSDDLAAAKKLRFAQVFLPVNVQADIDEIQTKLNTSSYTLSDRTAENKEEIRKLLRSVSQALVISAAVMLLLIILGFGISYKGWQCCYFTWAIIGSILVTGTFILSGTFVVLHNATADTCVAMNQWVENPTAHTALDDILPCVDNAHETTTRSKGVTSELVNLMNQDIAIVANLNFTAVLTPLYFNQSGPLMPLLCNPFRPDLTDRACEAREVSLSNATQVYGQFVCQVSAMGICTTTGRLTPDFYNQISAGINVSQRLYLYGPFLADVQDCAFVRQTFTDIYRDRCPGLRKNVVCICIGLLMETLAGFVSLFFWVIYGRERRFDIRLQTEKVFDMRR